MLPHIVKLARWSKTAGALMLLACYVLPMSSCVPARLDGQGALAGSTTGGAVPTKPAAVPGTPPSREYRYILPGDRSSVFGWVCILSFAIPAAAVLYVHRRPVSRTARILWPVEPAVLLFILVEVWSMTFLSSPEVGTYLAYGGLAAFWVGWLGEAFIRIRSRRISLRSMGLSLCAGVLLTLLIRAFISAALRPDSLEAGVQIGLVTSLAVYFFVIFSLGLDWMARRRRTMRSQRSSLTTGAI